MSTDQEDDAPDGTLEKAPASAETSALDNASASVMPEHALDQEQTDGVDTPLPEEAAELMDEWAAAGGAQLDQNSIDSLFGEVGETSIVETPRSGLGVLVGTAIVGYDRLPTLDIVVDRFARLLTSGVRKFTSDNCEVTVKRVRAMRVGDFLNRISLPAMIAVIHAEQWEGNLLAAIDSQLMGSVVDVMLGGRRNAAQPIEGRPYTPIERTLIERMVTEVIISDLKDAFSSICEIDFTLDRYETTPTYAAITELSAAAVHFRTEVSMDGGRGGYIDFLIPYAVLEPVRDVLAQEFIGKKTHSDTVWLNHLRGEVPQANVELQAVLEQRTINISTVARWRPGTILMLNRRHDDPVELTCEKMLVARAMIGEHDGRVALQIEEFFGKNTGEA